MEAAAIAVARAAHLAKNGDNHKKEAQLIFRLIQEGGNGLECHKSFEGARADFCVYMPDKPALGIQLKTTGVNIVHTRTGKEYYSFGKTDGYAGLLMVFVALHVEPQRIWLADGSKVVSKNVFIAVKQARRGARYDRLTEVDLATVGNTIHAIYDTAMSGTSKYVLRSPEDHEKPEKGSILAEYNAFKRLQRSLPVLFIDPPAEHMCYDYVVNGRKWQLKLAIKDDKRDVYRVICHKQAGKVGGKCTFRQYEVGDFDFLCIQLPESAVECCYVIPQGVLKELCVIGNATKSCGAVYIYPHRQVTTTKSVHVAGVHWTEAYRIDFADNPLAKLARITQG